MRDNKAIVRRIVEETFVNGNLGVADDLIVSDFVDHDAMPGTPVGPEPYKQRVMSFRAAVRDVQVSFDALLCERELVADRWTLTGVHVGELFGFAPTGKRLTVRGIAIWRIVNGQAVERWEQWDMFGLRRQLEAQ